MKMDRVSPSSLIFDLTTLNIESEFLESLPREYFATHNFNKLFDFKLTVRLFNLFKFFKNNDILFYFLSIICCFIFIRQNFAKKFSSYFNEPKHRWQCDHIVLHSTARENKNN